MQAVAELEAQVARLSKDKAAQQQALQRLESEVARLREGIIKNRVCAVRQPFSALIGTLLSHHVPAADLPFFSLHPQASLGSSWLVAVSPVTGGMSTGTGCPA